MSPLVLLCCFAIIFPRCTASQNQKQYTPMDINGAWTWECTSCYSFDSCTGETVYNSTFEIYSQSSLCTGPTTGTTGTQSFGQNGDFYIDGAFLARSVTDFYPKQQGDALLKPPLGGSFTITSVSSSQLDVFDQLTAATISLTCKSVCGNGLPSKDSTPTETTSNNPEIAPDDIIPTVISVTNPIISNSIITDPVLPENPTAITTVVNPVVVGPIENGIMVSDSESIYENVAASSGEMGISKNLRIGFLTLYLLAVAL